MPKFNNHESLCPELLKPLKLKLQNLYQQISTIWQNYQKARPEIFTREERSVRWSTSDEILNQVWEWAPLGNLRIITQKLFPYCSLYQTQIILAITFIALCLLTAFYLKFIYQQKYSFHRDNELKLLKSITQEHPKLYKNIYPSPNYPKQECKAKWFRLIPWVNLLPVFPIGNVTPY